MRDHTPAPEAMNGTAIIILDDDDDGGGGGHIPPPNSPVTPKPSPPPSPVKNCLPSQKTSVEDHPGQDTVVDNYTAEATDMMSAAIPTTPEPVALKQESPEHSTPEPVDLNLRAWYEEDAFYFRGFVTSPSQIGALHISFYRLPKEIIPKPEVVNVEEYVEPELKRIHKRKLDRVVIPGERKSRRFAYSKSPSPLQYMATPPPQPKTNRRGRGRPKKVLAESAMQQDVRRWFDALCELKICWPGGPFLVTDEVIEFRMAIELAKHGDVLSPARQQILDSAINQLKGLSEGHDVNEGSIAVAHEEFIIKQEPTAEVAANDYNDSFLDEDFF